LKCEGAWVYVSTLFVCECSEIGEKIENMMRVCVVSRLVFLLLVTLGFGGGLMALPLTTEFGARFEAAERGQFGAVAGEDPWFFLPSELRFLSVESFRGDTIRRLSRARDKQWADPVPAIVDFHEQLKRMGVKLLVVPVPAKAAIYPDRLFTGASKMVPGLPKALGELYGDLRQAGVDVLDFTEEFIANRDSEHGPVYCATDSHWSGLGCVLAAKVIAQQVGGLVGKGSSKGFAEKWEEAVVKGDLLDLPGKPATRVPHEKLWVRRITTTGGGAVKGESSSPILLLGDSHTLVFGELLCEGAGLVEQLGYELGVVPDLIGLRGAGATDVRGRLLRRGMKEDGYLRGKKVVIWCFGAREFSEADSGWVKLPVVK
jgi:alginate O-acetyltransferase complex protein AlgJ